MSCGVIKDLFLFANFMLISPDIKSVSFKLLLFKSVRVELNKVEMRWLLRLNYLTKLSFFQVRTDYFY